MMVLIYVDDIIITRTSTSHIQALISCLRQHFALKDMGRLYYFLGIKASWTTNGDLHLSQTKYIKDLFNKSNMSSARPQLSPMISSTRIAQDGSTTFSDTSLYRSIVGSLQYLILTCPEISYSVNKVCQFMYNPQEHHWKSVKRILRYLAGTIHHGLLLRKSPHLHIQAFANANWGLDLMTKNPPQATQFTLE